MRQAVNLFLILLVGIFAGCAPTTDRLSEGQSSPTPAGPASAFDIKVTSVERAKQWRPSAKGTKSLLLVKGASLVIGEGYVADSGYELAVVHLTVKRLVNGATLNLSDVAAIDDKGDKYPTVYEFEPLGKEAEETRDFIFPVKTGTRLRKLQLNPDVSRDLP